MTEHARNPNSDGPLISGPVTIELSNAEALVLLEFLARSQQSEPEQYAVAHQAEQRVLWDVHAILESQLIEPINNPRYDEAVDFARRQVADE